MDIELELHLNFLFVFGLFWRKSRERPERSFLEWIERLQKWVQVDGEYVGCTKRTQYIEIGFNREIRLCYT
jgi:hypothetical protein